MTIDDILNTDSHRPWPIQPHNNWKYYQEWNRAIFMHWEADINELRKFVPEELEIDLFEGKAWVSVVAFTMEKIRPKNLPSFSLVSNFDEINIRTYVKHKRKSGVYFLSIEAGNTIACKIARALSDLPYRYSKIKRQPNTYRSDNNIFNDHLAVDYEIGTPIMKKSALDLWLTERYALFQENKEYINDFDIHHIEWPVKEIVLNTFTINYPRFKTIFNGTPNCAHYSEGVKVVAWDKQKILRLSSHNLINKAQN